MTCGDDTRQLDLAQSNMISYEKHILSNGLHVLVNRDRASRLAAVNLLYRVGARDESPERTGFAHLFEHLMFRGTERVPEYDVPVQLACGDDNAFTNNDYTDFYLTLPKDNIELAFWLESDRMTGLDINDEKLEVEKRVVIEEYKQRYLNRPYGQMPLMLREEVYKVHPYRWSTIGLTPDHIASASLDEVRSFYHRYYRPSNAILAVSADISPDEVFTLAERYFGGIDDSRVMREPLPVEPEQDKARRRIVDSDVPAVAINIAFKIGGRTSRDFFLGDLTSDILAGGESSRLYERLIKGERLFSSVNAYVTGELDPGMFVFTGELLPTTTIAQAEQAIWREIERLATESVSDYELEKVRNKFEANTLFGELNIMNKAMNLSAYEMMGDLSLINREVDIYRSLGAEHIKDFSRRLFIPERSTTLIFKPLQQ